MRLLWILGFLTCVVIAETNKLADQAEKASLPGLLSRWVLKMKRVPVGFEVIILGDN